MSRQVRKDMGGDIDMSKWLKNESGGYQQATCKCEIECTPDSIDETCGGDIAIALDMSTCDAEKWERMTTFVNKLVSELEIEQSLGGERGTARVAVTLFAAEPTKVIGLDAWNVEDTGRPKHDIKEYFSEIKRNSEWTMFTGVGVDFEKTFDWAQAQFEESRNPGVDEEIESYNFETTKMFVIVSDGHIQHSRNAAQMREDLLMAKSDLGGKVITVSQSRSDSAICRNGGKANCPNRAFLGEIGDVFVDGGDVVDAAREVANIINQKKCVKHGECKPCNCECAFPRGPAGAEGEDGCNGQSGPCGDAGLPGSDGLPGKNGPMGDRGIRGIKGDCGDPGFPGEKGPPGDPAPTGVDANVGPEGLPGDRGDIGEPGDTGVKGFAGTVGPMGDPGKLGDPGPAGSPGPAGEPGGLILQNGRSSEVMTPEKYMEAIKIIVQEWMQKEENQEILECISECDDNGQKAEVTVGTECPPGSYYEPPKGSGNYKNNDRDNDNNDGNNNIGSGGSCVKNPDVDSCKEPLDIIFLVDGSDSIRKDSWPLVGNWTNSLLEMVNPLERRKDTKVIYQQYSSSSFFPEAIKYTITSDTKPEDAPTLYEGLKREINDQEQRSQGTDTYHALNEIHKMFATELRSTADGMGASGASDGVTTILITLTDGAARDRGQNRKDNVMEEIRRRVDGNIFFIV